VVVFKLLVILLVITSFKLAFAIETVKTVDLSRTMGTWYEIASIPNMWQADCNKNTKSSFSPKKDGTFEVKKSCITKTGQQKQNTGEGIVIQNKTSAEYKVNFVPLLHFLGWFTGLYKMILLDPEYRFAVIGEDKFEYGWILARRQNIPPRDLAEIETQVRALGYDTCKFMITIQERGPHHENVTLCQAVKP
jgi:apolipoprotein D and lipocalin family protein